MKIESRSRSHIYRKIRTCERVKQLKWNIFFSIVILSMFLFLFAVLRFALLEKNSKIESRARPPTNIAPFSNQNPKELQVAQNLAFKWVFERQFPDCANVVLQKCVTDDCGFLCQVNGHLKKCANDAMRHGRVFDVFTEEQFHFYYEYGDASNVLLPMTNVHHCQNAIHTTTMSGESPAFGESTYWIPPQLETHVKDLHPDPPLWFAGIWTRFLFRLTEKSGAEYRQLLRYLRQFERKLSVRQSSNVLKIGMHIRRTDKTTEANIYEWRAYIPLIEHYIAKFQNDNIMIVLATDDLPAIMQQIRELTPQWLHRVFINRKNVGHQRKTDNALNSVVLDCLLIAEGDVFIGQDSSGVSRVMYQLFAMRVPNYKQKSVSIDHFAKTGDFNFPWY